MAAWTVYVGRSASQLASPSNQTNTDSDDRELCYVDHEATVSMLGYYYITHQRGMIVYHVARQAGLTYRDRRRSETQHQPA